MCVCVCVCTLCGVSTRLYVHVQYPLHPLVNLVKYWCTYIYILNQETGRSTGVGDRVGTTGTLGGGVTNLGLPGTEGLGNPTVAAGVTVSAGSPANAKSVAKGQENV